MKSPIQPFSKRQTMMNPTYEIHHYKDSYLEEIALHHHDFYEIYFFISGEVNYLIESRNYQLKPGDILLISPLELHHPHILPQNEEAPYERIVLWISRIYLEELSSLESDLSKCFDIKSKNHTNLLRPREDDKAMFTFLTEQLLEESSYRQFGGDLAARSLITQILIRLNRYLLKEQAEVKTMDQSERIISDILRYINENLSSEISLDDLSSRFFVSKYHLSREFRRLVGTSVYRYIIQKRLLTAKQMMISGESPTSVSAACGFGDYTSFYRAFRGEYGISPKKFMQSLQDHKI